LGLILQLKMIWSNHQCKFNRSVRLEIEVSV